jgi:uncharacterized protein
MPRDTKAQPINSVRHPGQAVDDEEWIKALLHRAPVGVLATLRDGQPFINTNLFVYDEDQQAIYMHTAKVGRTRANIEADERICFSAMEMGRLLPHPEALQFSVEYSSVVVFGRAGVIGDQEEARRALQMLLDKYAPHLRPGRDYRAITDDELARTSAYTIQIELWSGKRETAPPDYPGAFVYRAQP